LTPENLVRVDKDDNVLGPIERLKAHRGKGILHRGLVVIVKNSRGEFLLTQRSESRPDLEFPPPFPGFWDLTLAGHPRWGQDDYITQMAVELGEEVGINANPGDIEPRGKFLYHVPDPTYPNTKSPPDFRLSEYEICGVGVVTTDKKPRLNRIELQSSLWVDREGVADKFKSLRMAPWSLLMVENLPKILD